MSTGSKKKRRIDRVTSVELPPGVLGNLWGHLRRGHVLVRLALCAVTAVLLWAITRGWAPPLPYHWGDVPPRDIVARTEFERDDPEATEEGARAGPQPGDRHLRPRSGAARAASRQGRKRSHARFVAAKSLAEVETLWDHVSACRSPRARRSRRDEEREQQFQKFREALAAEGALDKFKTALNEAFAPLMEKGVLEKLPPEHDANTETIAVRPVGTEASFDAAMCRSATCSSRTRRRRCRNRLQQRCRRRKSPIACSRG